MTILWSAVKASRRDWRKGEGNILCLFSHVMVVAFASVHGKYNYAACPSLTCNRNPFLLLVRSMTTAIIKKRYQ